jgi:hypothetical protein
MHPFRLLSGVGAEDVKPKALNGGVLASQR